MTSDGGLIRSAAGIGTGSGDLHPEHDRWTKSGFGLALGGGAFRGLAHVGVLDVLLENDLAPSWLAGTSAGAVAAALLAFGVSPDDMEEALEDVNWRTMSRLRPFAPIGVLTNEGLGETVKQVLGDVQIQDSLIPLRIVATDIKTGERIVLDRGPVTTAVRASSCLPGAFMPVEIQGRLLVDGSLVENVPVRAARELREGVIAAVSLGFDAPFDDVSNAIEVLVNAFEIAVSSQSRRLLRQADVLIEPKVSAFSKVLPKERAAIVAAGREAALTALPHLRAVLGVPAGG